MRLLYLLISLQLFTAVAQEDSVQIERGIGVPINDLIQEIIKFDQNLPTQFTLQYIKRKDKRTFNLSQAQIHLFRSSIKEMDGQDDDKEISGVFNSSLTFSKQHLLMKEPRKFSISLGPAFNIAFNRRLDAFRFGSDDLAFKDRFITNSFTFGIGGLVQFNYNLSDQISIGTQLSGLFRGSYQRFISESATLANGKEQSSEKEKTNQYIIQFQGNLPSLIFFTFYF